MRAGLESGTLEWPCCGHDALVMMASSERAIGNTWRPKCCRDATGKKPISSGVSDRDESYIFILRYYSFGMIMLETAANIVVPDMYVSKAK